jgi:mannose-6-phosphate isomerase-like protein (cupin superfamily)
MPSALQLAVVGTLEGVVRHAPVVRRVPGRAAGAAQRGRGVGMTETTKGGGWAVGSIDGMGHGPGFRKVRKELGVTAFGVNAVVLPPGYASGGHLHERQEELYFVHRGSIEFRFGGGETQVLGPGGFARVDPSTVRSMRNTSDTEEAVYVCVGGAGGYVGRDGVLPEGEPGAR